MNGRIFVTGGASGLGRAIAERWARAGWRVAIGDVNEARGAETLAALRASGAEAEFLRCDVTVEADLVAARDALEARWGGVDVVVNNAGVAMAGAIDEVTLEDWRWIVEVNLLGVVAGCRVFTPLFRRQGRGHFVNVASMAALLDAPTMSAYNATKAAVLSLSETLQVELAGDGIGVTVVCPSFFRTNLAENFRSPDPRLRAVTERLLERRGPTAADIAEDVFRGVRRGTFVVLPHAEGRWALWMKRLLPRRLWVRMMTAQARAMFGDRGRGGAG
jgi:NAD(P)-dependent dehydrogenase (short-subunit alcohol dehydrogenase family)